ncbi:MAG: hypothetical protein Q8P60_05875 [Pseudorhodobacter sp.]|nr:hypothetical protein [Pseudorhodobacter sp.]
MSVRVEEGRAVVSRLAGAFARALFVMAVVATPSVVLPGTGADGKQMVALVALFAGGLTFVEYHATYPGLIEFRDAPPFNRIRFLILFFTVFFLTVIAGNASDPTTLSTLIEALGALIGRAMDFPFSPVRLAAGMLADGATDRQIMAVRTAAGISYLVSLVGLSVFVVLMKSNSWPGTSGTFNVWVNLPTFDPTSGGDVVARLDRDARINIGLGFLLPFLTPFVVKTASIGFVPLTLTAPQTLIWTMTAWAFLPASLFMRGIAMSKIADMIRAKRRSGRTVHVADYSPA